jgi:hypothetical protein
MVVAMNFIARLFGKSASSGKRKLPQSQIKPMSNFEKSVALINFLITPDITSYEPFDADTLAQYLDLSDKLGSPLAPGEREEILLKASTTQPIPMGQRKLQSPYEFLRWYYLKLHLDKLKEFIDRQRVQDELLPMGQRPYKGPESLELMKQRYEELKRSAWEQEIFAHQRYPNDPR